MQYRWELIELRMLCAVGADSASWQQSIFRAVLSWACYWAWSVSVSFLSWIWTESSHKDPCCLWDLLQQNACRKPIFVFTLLIFPRKLLRQLSECHGFDCGNKNNRNSTANFVLVLAMRTESVTVHEVFLVQTPIELCSQQHGQKLNNFHRCWNIKDFLFLNLYLQYIVTDLGGIDWVWKQVKCFSLLVLGFTIKSAMEI